MKKSDDKYVDTTTQTFMGVLHIVFTQQPIFIPPVHLRIHCKNKWKQKNKTM